jgi:hypothetical protein
LFFGPSPKSVATAEGRPAREAGERVKPMVPPCGMGISCKRSPSPGQPGQKMQGRSADFSVVERAPFAAQHNRCCAFALPTDTERREPHSFARFAGSWGAPADTHGLRHGLSSFARFAGSPAFGLAPPPSRQQRHSPTGFLRPATQARRPGQQRAGRLPRRGAEFIEGKALPKHVPPPHFWDRRQNH